MTEGIEPACSVIICVRNGADTLAVQLDALAAQVDPPPFEVMVVDNGSTDATAEVFRRWADGVVGRGFTTRLIDASAREGLGYARNVGASHARGRILAYCDGDDMVGSGWLRAAYAGLPGGAQAAVSGPILRLAPGGVPTSDVLMGTLDGIRPDHGGTGNYPCFWGCNFAITSEAFQEVGGFDEALPPYGCDDIDICIRLAGRGLEIGFVPDMAVYYSLPRGLRRRLRRKSRAGVAQACLWARHPQVYAQQTPAQIALGTVHDISAAARMEGDPATRLLRCMEVVAARVGQLWGTYSWVGRGRLGAARFAGASEPGAA